MMMMKKENRTSIVGRWVTSMACVDARWVKIVCSVVTSFVGCYNNDVNNLKVTI